MTCKDFEQSLSLLLYHELPREGQQELGTHLAACAPCRAALEEGRRLQQLLSRRPAVEPTPVMLAECRQALDEALDLEPPRPRWQELFGEWFSFLPANPAFRAAGALGVLFFGFSLGWALRPRAGAIPSVAPEVGTSAILDNMRIGDISRVAPGLKTGEVHITLDAARRVSLEGSLDDPKIQQLLVSAVKSYDNPGIRRDTLDALRTRGDNPNIRQALLYAMGHDSNLGVRLEALDAVRGLDWGADSRLAFLNVLEHDTNPGLRAAAVDELSRHTDPDMLATFKRLAANDSNRYVRLKVASAVRELGAR